MSQSHRLQQQRFELKYLVDESITGQMRDFMKCYLEPDSYSLGKPNFSYPVHSLYLDSDFLKTHQDCVNGTKNRYKLRLRYYDADPETPVFFELKARVDNSIFKRRCGVRREAVPLLLSGQLPEQKHLLSHEARHWGALHDFIHRMACINASPKVHNAYLREAWVSPYDNSIRVTFDRNIRAEPHFALNAPIEMIAPIKVYSEFVVLEIKFTTRYPNWVRDMVECFNLVRTSSAKYSGAVEDMGEYRLIQPRILHQWTPFPPNLSPKPRGELTEAVH